MVTIVDHTPERFLAKFDTREEVADVLDLLLRDHHFLPSGPLFLTYLPACVPQGDSLTQPGYIGFVK